MNTHKHTIQEIYGNGMQVRQAVLGEDHANRVKAETNDTTEDFQDLVTRYEWGEIWMRPGLDRRTRSVIALTALVVQGHYDELAIHLEAALRIGLTRAEIIEVLLQTTMYCGVPAANRAFQEAQRVLECFKEEHRSAG